MSKTWDNFIIAIRPHIDRWQMTCQPVLGKDGQVTNRLVIDAHFRHAVDARSLMLDNLPSPEEGYVRQKVEIRTSSWGNNWMNVVVDDVEIYKTTTVTASVTVEDDDTPEVTPVKTINFKEFL